MNSRESKQHTDFRLTSSLADEIQAAYREAGETFYVLDLGCGKGLYQEDMKETLSELGDKDVDIIGFDINREALEYSGDTETAQADLVETGIPAGDSSVDFVYSNHLRCQIDEEKLERIEEDAERALRDTGRQYHRC